MNFPASLFESNQMFLYETPFFVRMSFASDIAVSSPSRVNELIPTTAPPFSASCLFSSSRSASSLTQGLHVVNQKFTTVTVFPSNSVLLSTSLPSRSLPSNAGNFIRSSFSIGLPFSAGTLILPSDGFPPQPGNFCSRIANLPSISRICSAPSLSSFSSSALN